MDVAKVRNQVVTYLRSEGFKPRDADGTDFADEDGIFRFKVGTVYGEVTVTVWQGARCVDTIRVLNEEQSKQDGMRRIEDMLYPMKVIGGLEL